MNKYRFGALVTISLSAVVEADSEEAAREKLKDYGLETIHTGYYDDYGEDGDEWKTSGELDGMPHKIELVSVNGEDVE